MTGRLTRIRQRTKYGKTGQMEFQGRDRFVSRPIQKKREQDSVHRNNLINVSSNFVINSLIKLTGLKSILSP